MDAGQAKRRGAFQAALLAIALTVTLLASGCGEDGASSAAGRRPRTEGSAAGPPPRTDNASPEWQRIVHDRGGTHPLAPIVALNCPVGNAYRCDRLVFDYSIALPARHLRAWVAGRPVRGMRGAPIVRGAGPNGVAGLSWSGHVQPAGLTEPGSPIEIHSRRPNYWAGVPPVTARVRVVAELKRGGTVSEVFPYVRIAPGFG